jgi:hypothetical protein
LLEPPAPPFLRGLSAKSKAKMTGNWSIFKNRSGFRFTPRTARVRCTGAQLLRANCRCLQYRSLSLCQVPPPPPFLRGLSAESNVSVRGKAPVGKNKSGFRLHPARRLSEGLPANYQHFPHQQFRTRGTAGSLHWPRTKRLRMAGMFDCFKYPGVSTFHKKVFAALRGYGSLDAAAGRSPSARNKTRIRTRRTLGRLNSAQLPAANCR